MNVVSYLRVSSRHQIDGDGFARQRIAIAQWIGTHSAVHLAEFVEEGVSGTTEVINRPALTRLVTTVLERGDIDAVIVEKSDRLARDLITSEILLKQFVEMGVKVIEAEGGNDLTSGNGSPTSVLIRQVLAAFAQFEKSSIVSKLRSARNRKRAETGRCEGRKPYGATAVEQRAVARILELDGMPTRAIADTLNAERVPTRSGVPWRHSTVAAILSRSRRSTEEEFVI